MINAPRTLKAYNFMIDPVAIPDGTPVFAGITNKLLLELTASRLFESGVMLVSYRPEQS